MKTQRNARGEELDENEDIEARLTNLASLEKQRDLAMHNLKELRNQQLRGVDNLGGQVEAAKQAVMETNRKCEESSQILEVMLERTVKEVINPLTKDIDDYVKTRSEDIIESELAANEQELQQLSGSIAESKGAAKVLQEKMESVLPSKPAYAEWDKELDSCIVLHRQLLIQQEELLSRRQLLTAQLNPLSPGHGGSSSSGSSSGGGSSGGSNGGGGCGDGTGILSDTTDMIALLQESDSEEDLVSSRQLGDCAPASEVLFQLSNLYGKWLFEKAKSCPSGTIDLNDLNDKARYRRLALKRLKSQSFDNIDRDFFKWFVALKFFDYANFSRFYEENMSPENAVGSTALFKRLIWIAVTYSSSNDSHPVYSMYLEWCIDNVPIA